MQHLKQICSSVLKRSLNKPVFLVTIRKFARGISAIKKPLPKAADIVKNEDIPFAELRVVFKNAEGLDEHKIMKKMEVVLTVIFP